MVGLPLVGQVATDVDPSRRRRKITAADLWYQFRYYELVAAPHPDRRCRWRQLHGRRRGDRHHAIRHEPGISGAGGKPRCQAADPAAARGRTQAFGEQALQHARAALDHLEALRQEARTAGGEETGSLRIAAFPSVFATVLPPLLRRFRNRYPGIDVIALETDDREVEDWLAAGSVDLGVVLNPASASGTVPIGQDAWVAVLPTSHVLARHRALALSQLATEPFVLATGGCHMHAGTLMEEESLSLADIRMEVRDWASAVALVREGVGVSIVPESTLPERSKGLKAVALDPAIFRRFGLVPSPARARSRAVESFLQAASAS